MHCSACASLINRNSLASSHPASVVKVRRDVPLRDRARKRRHSDSCHSRLWKVITIKRSPRNVRAIWRANVNLDFSINDASIYLHEILAEYLRVRRKKRRAWFLNGLAFHDTGALISLSGKINDSWLIICTCVICDKNENDKSVRKRERERETEKERENEREFLQISRTVRLRGVGGFVISTHWNLSNSAVWNLPATNQPRSPSESIEQVEKYRSCTRARIGIDDTSTVSPDRSKFATNPFFVTVERINYSTAQSVVKEKRRYEGAAVHSINPAVHPVRVERANWKGARWRSVSLHLDRRSATDATCYVACYNYLDPFALPELFGIALYVVRIHNESSRCINVDEKEPSYVRSIVAFSLGRTYPADMPIYRYRLTKNASRIARHRLPIFVTTRHFSSWTMKNVANYVGIKDSGLARNAISARMYLWEFPSFW